MPVKTILSTIFLLGTMVFPSFGEGLDLAVDGGSVKAAALQPDGMVIVAGEFTKIGGRDRERIARISPEGEVDGFAGGGGADDRINCAVVQPDGKVLVAGRFGTIGSEPRNRIARLQSDGTVEPTDTFDTGTGADGEVFAMALQPDGMILIAGDFASVGGEARGGIARLHPDGSIENTGTFDTGVGADGAVRCVVLQQGGKILISGAFTHVAGVPRNRIARLNADGSLDLDFNPGANGSVESIVVDASGHIVVGGEFTEIDGMARPHLARLFPDGSVEYTGTFDPGSGPDAAVRTMSLQADGKLVIAGDFTGVDGQPRSGIARLLADGTLETTATFNAGNEATGPMDMVMLLRDGGVLIGGGFAGESPYRIASFSNGLPDTALEVPDYATVEWLRDGTAPEIGSAVFEISTDEGATWTRLGSGVRTNGGWRCSGLELPPTGWLRARGATTGAAANGSGGMVEEVQTFVNHPGVTTLAATEVTTTAAKLNGKVNPNGRAFVYFEYGLDESFGSQTSTRMCSGPEYDEMQEWITGLQAGTTYYYRFVAANVFATCYGETRHFTTSAELPMVVTANPSQVGGTEATLAGAVNPMGESAEVYFDYGTTTGYGAQTPAQTMSDGETAIDVAATVSGMNEGQIYHCRIVATSSHGTSYGQDVSFVADAFGTATAPPAVATGDAKAISAFGATLQGTVNPNSGFASAWFEYGLTNEYAKRTPIRGAGNLAASADLSARISGLAPGTTYHYRIVATNSEGRSEGADATFRTSFLPPVVKTGRAEVFADAGIVRLHGSVRANNAGTYVFYEYGTDETHLSVWKPATPFNVMGDEEIHVTGDLNILDSEIEQTYYYRFWVGSNDGEFMGSLASFTLDIRSKLYHQFTPEPSDSTASLQVDLAPEGVNGGWRFAGEPFWRKSGDVATGLVPGDHQVEYKPVAEHIQPPPETVTVTEGEYAALARTYYDRAAGGGGGLRVVLLPSRIAGGEVPEAERARWRLLGDADGQWRDSGEELTGLVPGTYLVECKPVAGWEIPAPHPVEVSEGETGESAFIYVPAGPAAGVAPRPVDFEDMFVTENLPYAYVGQVRSSLGSGSGFVVRPRVVATAAHIVFDEENFTWVENIQWLFEEMRDVFEPEPRTPDGYCVFNGYSGQRQTENTPGEFSPASRNLDVAALYFANEDAGRGGFSGFLASDLPNNEFLTSPALKILVGYPVQGVSESARGTMHATPAMNVAFTQGYGNTYATTDIRGMEGCSGGPLCVRHEDGKYYPAAIYLGGNGETVVRAIDKKVVNLFNYAEGCANGDVGGIVGAGITQSSVHPLGSAAYPGSLTVLIEPREAREAGALWWLSPEARYRPPGATCGGLNPGEYIIQFKAVEGFAAPAPQTVLVEGGKLKEITYTYGEALGELEQWRLEHFGTTSNSGEAADSADADHDGAKNIDEFLAGTDPNNPADRFRIASLRRNDGGVAVECAGKAGRIYELQRRSETTNGQWLTVDTSDALDTDGQVSLSDPSSPEDWALYRILVSMPTLR